MSEFIPPDWNDEDRDRWSVERTDASEYGPIKFASNVTCLEHERLVICAVCGLALGYDE